ncbi:MAG: formyltransferase family protein, partial [Firmicutes bacterium]|nr:formyltransferase family protein [Bacillota bacterium]
MNRLTRIAVLVSGGGTNLQAIIDAQKSGIIRSGEVSLVLSNSASAYALTRAEKEGIPAAVVTRKKGASEGLSIPVYEVPDKETQENKLMELIDEAEIDLIVLAGFMVVLSERFINHYKDRIINVHPSLIPSFCGDGFYGLKV